MHAVPSDFWQWINKFNGEDITGFVVTVSICSLAALAIICAAIYKIHKTRVEDALKRELLDRGMSADEIATVLSAKPVRSDSRRPLRN